MDPFSILGVTASIIACVQLTGSLLKRVGPSDHSREDLNRILRVVCGFKGAYESLKSHLEFNEEDQARLSTLQHLEEPLRECKHVLSGLEARLKSTNIVGRYVVGKLWDGKMKSWMQRLDDAKALFELALHADQQIILSAIERYVHNTAIDIRDVKTTIKEINDNGKRLLDHDDQAHEHHKRAEIWYAKAGREINKIDGDVFKLDQASQRQYQSINENTRQVGEEILDYNRDWRLESQKIVEDEERCKILQWLSCTDPTVNHNAACEKHEPTTGNWFLHSSEYQQWKESHNSFLWLHGIPGCGKTVLCSTIIRHTVDFCAAEPATRAIAFFYFSFTDAEKQKIPNLLRSLLGQLAGQHRRIPHTIRDLYSRYKNGQPPPDAVKATLKSLLELPVETFLIIDALDESLGSEVAQPNLADILSEFSAWAVPGVHILATSRREPVIEEILAPLVTLPPICIQERQIDDDIRVYVRTQLASDAALRKWSPDIKAEIELTLVKGANGMFRWVFCQLEALKKCLRPKDVREALNSLPATLNETYERILLSISPQYHQEAINALQWLACSAQPLTIEELAEAAVINPRADPPFDPDDRLADPHNIIQILSGLVTVSTRLTEDFSNIPFWVEPYDVEEARLVAEIRPVEEIRPDEEIKLAHFSVKEYLLSDQVKHKTLSAFYMTEAISNQSIAEGCLTYMRSYKRLNSAENKTSSKQDFPLLYYSSRFWPNHLPANQDGTNNFLSSMVFGLFDSESELSSWLKLYNPAEPEEGPYGNISSSTALPLYYACLLGSQWLVQYLLEQEHDVNEQCEYGGALHAAASGSNEAIVQILLGHGADVNANGGIYGCALQTAAHNGNKSIVQILLDKGADINAEGSGVHSTALQAAAYRGFEAIVQLLLDQGANANAKGSHDGSALQAAACGGYMPIVQLLLDHGADINAQAGGYYGSALQAAVCGGQKAIVQLLLDQGANANAKGGHNGSALQAAACGGYMPIVQLLLDHGADINAQAGGCYGSALQAAACGGYIPIVQLLLDHGADVNAQSPKYGSALRAAAIYDHKAVVQLLLDRGATDDQ